MKQKRLFTKLILVLVVICFGITNASIQLHKKVEEVEKIFMDGENNDGLSVHYDLTKIDDSLSYFLSLSKLYDVKSTSISSLENLHKNYGNLKDIKDYATWYKDVKKAYPIAISEMRLEKLTSQHTTMLNKYEATFNSASHTIAYSSFHSTLREYEKETKGILADILKALTKVKGVASFD